MQLLVRELQHMIKTYYGFNSDIELKPCHSYQTLQKEVYSSMDKSLMIPLFEPKTKHPIAFFKVYDVASDDKEQHNRLYDLVHLTLQSHINLLDELDVAESLLNYLQVEFNPKKVIRLRTTKPQDTELLHRTAPQTEIVKKDDHLGDSTEILLICKNQTTIDHLALEIHQCIGNHFFIRTDYMAATFMNSISDLLNLTHTTLYIPKMDALSVEQQKTLASYLLIGNLKENNVLVVCGSLSTITKMSATSSVSLDLLKHLNVFNVLRDTPEDAPAETNLASIRQCAQAILGSSTHHNGSIQIRTKSYHLIPSLNDIFPTVH
ncbi:MAG: hypothetical protein IT287_02060 [Bdellovibrionaceae bacterium]|nr:hypothetical protein [Pseudobdellovibrionaceae bacterium]